MAEGGVKPDFSEPEDDHVVQTLRKELGLIKGQIELAQKRQDTEEELRKEIESAKAQLAALSQIHDVGTGFIQKTVVAFTAKVAPPDLTGLGAGQTIVFDEVITNVGNGYDNLTGIFTAPVSGVYVFDMALMVASDVYQYTELVKDGQSIVYNYSAATGVNCFVSSSRTVTLQLEKASKVWVRTITENITFHGSGKVHGNGFSTFSGWLLAATG